MLDCCAAVHYNCRLLWRHHSSFLQILTCGFRYTEVPWRYGIDGFLKKYLCWGEEPICLIIQIFCVVNEYVMCMEIYSIFIFASSGNRSIGFLSQLMHLPFVSFPFSFFFLFFFSFLPWNTNNFCCIVSGSSLFSVNAWIYIVFYHLLSKLIIVFLVIL